LSSNKLKGSYPNDAAQFQNLVSLKFQNLVSDYAVACIIRKRYSASFVVQLPGTCPYRCLSELVAAKDSRYLSFGNLHELRESLSCSQMHLKSTNMHLCCSQLALLLIFFEICMS
jgi:hypothetical protein